MDLGPDALPSLLLQLNRASSGKWWWSVQTVSPSRKNKKAVQSQRHLGQWEKSGCGLAGWLRAS